MVSGYRLAVKIDGKGLCALACVYGAGQMNVPGKKAENSRRFGGWVGAQEKHDA